LSKHWQERAEEAWAIASEMTDAHTKAIMVGIAQGYEIKAQRMAVKSFGLRLRQ
jgi:hypothetical protein